MKRNVFIYGGLGLHHDTIVSKIFDYISTVLNSSVMKCPDAVFSNDPWHLQSTSSEFFNLFKDFSENFSEPLTVLFPEFWNPAIESVKIYSRYAKLDVKLVAIHHGSSHIDGDFVADFVGPELARSMEYSWLSCLDYLLVGSEYAKESIVKIHPEFEDKIIVTYLPITHLKYLDRSNFEKTKILFPHRLSVDKGWFNSFHFIEYLLSNKNFDPDNFVVCTPVMPSNTVRESFNSIEVKINVCTRKNFHKHMYSCTHVFSDVKQETFGYSVLESFFSGCLPVLSDHLLYREFFGDHKLFSSGDYQKAFEILCSSYPEIIRDSLLNKFDKAEENICNILTKM